MPAIREPFDQLKIDKLKHYLEDMVLKGQPKPYEIFVDALKVVPKTEDPKDFDSYEYYMSDDTEKIRIIIYNTAHSPRNDQYTFWLQQAKNGNGLEGLENIDARMQAKLDAQTKEFEFIRLKEKLEETQKQLTESETYIETLEDELELAKSNKYKLGKINLGELASIAVESMVRKNTDLIAKIPGAGQALAGIIELDNEEKSKGVLLPPSTTEGEASFKKKATSTAPLSEVQQHHLTILNQLEQHLDEAQLNDVMELLHQIVQDTSRLDSIKQFLNQ